MNRIQRAIPWLVLVIGIAYMASLIARGAGGSNSSGNGFD